MSRKGLSSDISRWVSGRIAKTRRGTRAVVGSQPLSRKAARSQRPRVRRAAFTGGIVPQALLAAGVDVDAAAARAQLEGGAAAVEVALEAGAGLFAQGLHRQLAFHRATRGRGVDA